MLSSLKIKNYALLKDVEIEFGPGLNILTGETGAGKSIILGAMNTIIGERGWIENIRTGEEKAVVEAVFDIAAGSSLRFSVDALLEEAGIEHADDRLVIRREIARTSKGRININNSNASLAFLEKLGTMLVDMHGQHEHQSLLKNEVHINLLDSYALCMDLREEAARSYAQVSSIDAQLQKMKSLETEKSERLEMVDFRLDELEALSPGADTELEDLNRERDMMVHTETIKESANRIVVLLQPGSIDQEGEGAIDQLSKARAEMELISKFDTKTKSELGPSLDEAIM
ncbi:MAG: AAA family ATPase, partial [Spirochaetia bacterium]|nr:AAA family ATPase [Spirochaetia bacterium]